MNRRYRIVKGTYLVDGNDYKLGYIPEIRERVFGIFPIWSRIDNILYSCEANAESKIKEYDAMFNPKEVVKEINFKK